MAGLLDYANQSMPQNGMNMQNSAMTNSPMANGILGGASNGDVSQIEKTIGIQLATELYKNPTKQTAQIVISKLNQMQMQGADELTNALQQIQDNPEMLREIAKQSIELLSQ